MTQEATPDTPIPDSRDIETLALMIALTCRGKHKNVPKLDLVLENSDDPPIIRIYKVCEDCYDLALYAFERVENCPNEDPEEFCSNCTTHCYSAEKHEKIRAVMRYAGPRMMLYHPRMAIRHALARGKKPHSKN